MPKVTSQEIIDLGFSPEMFKKENEAELSSYIDDIIGEHADILSGRIGSSAYNSTISPTNKYVRRAEKCLVAAELVQRRINVILGNAIGAGREIDISHEGAQKRAYLDEAESLILKIAAGQTLETSDFSSGVLVTSSFEETDA